MESSDLLLKQNYVGLNSTMSEQKFEIAGEIEGNTKSQDKRSINGRFFLFVFVIIVVGGIWYFPFLQDSFPALKKITMNAEPHGAVDSSLLNYTATLHKLDSITRVNDSLQKLNTLLIESSNDNTGIYYEIQIGAFKNFDLEKYQRGLKELHAETTIDGTDKLTLGKFRDLNTAKYFLADVREMGFKDAWIVAKENGVRIAFDSETGE